LCQCVGACVRKRDRESKREKEGKRQKMRDSVCVQVYELGGSDAGIWHERQYVHASKCISMHIHILVYIHV